MKINQEIKDKIQEKEDLFFDKSSEKYHDMSIFDELFEILSEPDFKNNFPKQHFAELNRVRDLKNTIDTAREIGREIGRMKIKIKVAKKGLKEGCPIELIAKMTDLSIKEIKQLEEELKQKN